MQKDKLFESAFKNSSIGMALVGPDGRWLDVNPSLCKLLGYSEEEMLQMTFQCVTHPEDKCIGRALVKDFLSGKISSHVSEKRYIHKNGDVIWAQLTSSAIIENGEFRLFVSQIQDITERKKASQRIATASKMAALGEMAAGIAHEINNPLTVIEGNTSILKMKLRALGHSDADIMNRLERISSTVARISSIIAGMRNFSRKSKNTVEDAQLKVIISETLNLCREKMVNSAVDLNVKVDPKFEVRCNHLELSQVILNLVNNAHHAVVNADTKRKISIQAKENTKNIEIHIADSGPGIPLENRAKIMKPFFTTKPLGAGTGLGLSLSKEMMERMGGSLTLDETKQETTFVLKVPKALKTKVKAAKPAIHAA